MEKEERECRKSKESCERGKRVVKEKELKGKRVEKEEREWRKRKESGERGKRVEKEELRKRS